MARNRDYDDGDFDQPKRSSPYQDMDGDEYDDDVDEIVDPLAGLRGAEDDLRGLGAGARDDTLDLGADYGDLPAHDGLWQRIPAQRVRAGRAELRGQHHGRPDHR